MANRHYIVIGDRFERLVVIGKDKSRHYSAWYCQCDCGKRSTVSTSALTGRKIKSCGCLSAERAATLNLKHGFAAKSNGIVSLTYTTWASMKVRCSSKKSRSHAKYGGRGINVCERWLSFENFLADMGERPPGTTLDRIDNDGDYEPGNCRWATAEQQHRNTSRNVILTVDGVSMCLTDWAAKVGLEESTLRSRVHRLGWDHRRAVTTPARSRRPPESA